MIHCVLILNNFGNPRLAKFYTPLDIQSQQALIKQVSVLLSTRSPTHSNFLTLPELLQSTSSEEDVRVVFRLYATLNFVFIVDRQENELGILDLIQVFVEALDQCFENVCELDLVFGWDVVHTVLEELIQGGMVLETNVSRIVDAINKVKGPQSASILSKSGSTIIDRFGDSSLWNEESLKTAGRALDNVRSTLRSYLPGS